MSYFSSKLACAQSILTHPSQQIKGTPCLNLSIYVSILSSIYLSIVFFSIFKRSSMLDKYALLLLLCIWVLHTNGSKQLSAAVCICNSSIPLWLSQQCLTWPSLIGSSLAEAACACRHSACTRQSKQVRGSSSINLQIGAVKEHIQLS